MSYKSELILRVKKELAKQWKCDITDIDGDKNIFLVDEKQCYHMITFGRNILIRGNKELIDWTQEQQFASEEAKLIMESRNLFTIESKLRDYNKRLAGEHIRFLYENIVEIEEPQNGLRFELYDRDRIQELFEWKDFHNALNYKTDVIAVGAFDGDQLVALAGADNNMEPLWQIGIDTLLEYRKKGVAVYLVNRLTREILLRDKIPFYTTWAPNIASCRVAMNAGFFPAWLEYFTEDVK